MRYGIAHLQDIEELDDGRCPYRPVRHHFGITTFGATTWTAKNAGDRLLNEHDEKDEFDELYLVISGTARFVLAGDTVQAQTGTFVHVPAGVMRTAFGQEAGTTVLAIGGGRDGEPFRPGGWEVWSPLRRLMQAGRHEELVARARPLLDDGPPYPELLYNVACSESLLGHTGDALDHLRRAIQLMPEIARFARDDQDLAALRDEPGFAELISN
jgi:hypothetical protein